MKEWDHLVDNALFCCVRQCVTSFYILIGLGVLRFMCICFYFTSSLHKFYSSSGSLFFTHLGSIIYIVQYIYNRPNTFSFIYIYLQNNCTVT